MLGLAAEWKNSKLDLRSRQFIFVGVADGTKGYKYYNKSTCQILTSQNVVFEVEGEKSHDVEIIHPALLEGESEESSKQRVEKVSRHQKLKDHGMHLKRKYIMHQIVHHKSQYL